VLCAPKQAPQSRHVVRKAESVFFHAVHKLLVCALSGLITSGWRCVGLCGSHAAGSAARSRLSGERTRFCGAQERLGINLNHTTVSDETLDMKYIYLRLLYYDLCSPNSWDVGPTKALDYAWYYYLLD
jgi:hypothetical protein